MAEENNYYQQILDKLYKFIAERGDKVSFDELIKWAEENNVGSITLSIALNDLVNWGKIIALEGFFEPENYIVAFSVPRSVKIVEEKVEKKEIEEKKEKLEEEREEIEEKVKEEVEKLGEEEEREREEVVEAGFKEEEMQSQSKVVTVAEEEKEKEASSRLEIETINDEDLKRAIEYLNDYWSVGVIRFLHDLKVMGIPNPDLILKKLINLEYVVYLPIGVINATSKLPRVKRPKKLSEFI